MSDASAATQMSELSFYRQDVAARATDSMARARLRFLELRGASTDVRRLASEIRIDARKASA